MDVHRHVGDCLVFSSSTEHLEAIARQLRISLSATADCAFMDGPAMVSLNAINIELAGRSRPPIEPRPTRISPILRDRIQKRLSTTNSIGSRCPACDFTVTSGKTGVSNLRQSCAFTSPLAPRGIRSPVRAGDCSQNSVTPLPGSWVMETGNPRAMCERHHALTAAGRIGGCPQPHACYEGSVRFRVPTLFVTRSDGPDPLPIRPAAVCCPGLVSVSRTPEYVTRRTGVARTRRGDAHLH
jgi:hypothetical protein